MAKGLAVSGVVNVSVSLAGIAAPTRNFGLPLHVGYTDVIDVGERIRFYSDMAGVASDFGTTDPEYKAATRHFGQTPQPSLLAIGRWAKYATKAVLKGGVLSASQQLMSNFTSITTGAFALVFDGAAATQITGINLSAQTNLNGVAAQIQTRLAAAVAGTTCVWDATNGRFVIKGATTGASATLGYAAAPSSGTDVSALFKLTSGLASAPIAGVAAETLDQGLVKLIDQSGDWYAAIVVDTTYTDEEALAASALIEAQGKKRRLGLTVTATTAIDSSNTSDLPSQLKAAGYKRTFVQYSSSDAQAVASFFARASTVNFNGSNTTITLKFKTEPGVTPETLTQTQANTLKSKNINVFVNYDNGTAILQEGVNCDGSFFDEWHGLDWLENDIQTAVWNRLYSSTTKIPQTDEGNNSLVTTISSRLDQAVTNGLLAPGKWLGPSFGQLATNDMLPKGYYVYVAPVATQAQADREARKSMPFQIAAKGAGAIHFADIAITFNR